MAYIKFHIRLKGYGAMLRLIILMFLLITGGCATTVENVKNLSADHRTVVVSVLGDNFQIDSVGTTIFQGWRITEDVSDWKIDDRVEGLIEEKLNGSSKVTVMPFDSAQMRSEIGQVKIDDWSGARVNTDGMKALFATAKAAGAHSVLLVGTFPKPDVIHGRKSIIKGYGIYQSSFLGIKDAVNFVILQMWLIDVETGEDIARVYKLGKSSRNHSVWLEKDMQLDEKTKMEIRKGFETMLDSTVLDAVKTFSFN